MAITNKPVSTYERAMKDHKFKKAFEKSYKELLLSELVISIMDNDKKAIKKLINEVASHFAT